MRIGIIGGGNIGVKRAQALCSFREDQIVAIAEIDKSRNFFLEKSFGARVVDDHRLITQSPDIEAVVISTPPWNHISLIQECLENGKDVLCEKPLGETLAEVRQATLQAHQEKRVLKCGFNLRHDRGLERAYSLLQEGMIGVPYFMKGHYVNGCVLVNTNRVGSLMDMGSHLLDLCRWFGGDPKDFGGFLQQTEFDKDDNGFITFRINGLIGQIHFSFIRWQNHFQWEVSGNQGTLEVIGLPKWGRQEVRVQRRVYPSGMPETTVEFFEEDLTWQREWEVFRKLCQKRDLSWNDHALKVMELMETIQQKAPLIKGNHGAGKVM